MEAIPTTSLRAIVRNALAEDIGRGDITTEITIPSSVRGRARIVTGSLGLVAGLPVARACFAEMEDDPVGWVSLDDGARIKPGDVVATVESRLRSILTAERTALNLLSRVSGVATATAEVAELVKEFPIRITDTRKTTPGLRLLEKYAVRVGGGFNHRFGLDDGILIKDNHSAAAGGVSEAVRRAKAKAPHSLRVEVEVADLTELAAALATGADAILLDNMTVEQVREAVAKAGGKVLLEVSGGVTRDNVAEYASTGVDVISMGAITHSARHMDFSLEVDA